MTSPATGRPIRVFLVGYSGVHNVGDEAIRAAILAAASGVGAEVVAIASHDAADPHPRAVPMRGLGLWRYLRAIIRADRVVLGGGGILKDEGLRMPLELFATALGARLLRRDVTLVAVGVGPFYSRPGRWLAMATARLARVRTVRDADSATALEGLGVRRVVLGADPTFSFEPVTAAAASEQRVVAVSLRRWYRTASDGEARQAALRDAVAAALDGPIGDGWRARLLSCYWPRDLAEMRALAADPRLGPAELLEHELDWGALTAALADAGLVAAMRYHAVAAAAMAGRPVVALAYEPKVRALAAELGLPIVDVEAPDLAASLARAVATAVADPASARPDPVALAALRDRAWLALRLALGPRLG
jgi:polysaccharide pyruvyl transferase CsaB